MFSQPEVAEITFAARVSIPVLFITGTHDRVFPYETSQTPMFEHLGTAETDKHWVRYDGSHGVRGEFREQVYQEIQDWLDEYFGPVG
jgi:dipeptidyl aminopeptidase/acylaminoacyl peptidase